MRLAFADPPYLGCCSLYGHEHNDDGPMPWDGRCWDDMTTHYHLVDYLTSFDGWAYCLSTPSLLRFLAATPTLGAWLNDGARVAAWVKPFASYKPDVRLAYSWEPVLFKEARSTRADAGPLGRDHLSQRITLKKGLVGAKPPEFCAWVLDLMGYVEGDEVVDVFPGTGIMGRVLDHGRLAL